MELRKFITNIVTEYLNENQIEQFKNKIGYEYK
jgi:hypothetical protein